MLSPLLLLLLWISLMSTTDQRFEFQNGFGFGFGFGSSASAFELPPIPCTNQTALINNYVLATSQSRCETLVTEGAYMMGLSGCANHIGGTPDHPIVSSLVAGVFGTVSHSHTAVLSYGNRPLASKHNHEVRVAAWNGATFEGTELRAAALLVSDQPDDSWVQTGLLSDHLVLESTTAVARILALTPHRFRWSGNYSSSETRFRYGLRPSEANLVDPAVAPINRTVVRETEPAAVIDDTNGGGLCGLDIVGTLASELTSGDGNDGGAIDLMSLISMLVQSVEELNARLLVLEP